MYGCNLILRGPSTGLSDHLDRTPLPNCTGGRGGPSLPAAGVCVGGVAHTTHANQAVCKETLSKQAQRVFRRLGSLEAGAQAHRCSSELALEAGCPASIILQLHRHPPAGDKGAFPDLRSQGGGRGLGVLRLPLCHSDWGASDNQESVFSLYVTLPVPR